MQGLWMRRWNGRIEQKGRGRSEGYRAKSVACRRMRRCKGVQAEGTCRNPPPEAREGNSMPPCPFRGLRQCCKDNIDYVGGMDAPFPRDRLRLPDASSSGLCALISLAIPAQGESRGATLQKPGSLPRLDRYRYRSNCQVKSSAPPSRGTKDTTVARMNGGDSSSKIAPKVSWT